MNQTIVGLQTPARQLKLLYYKPERYKYNTCLTPDLCGLNSHTCKCHVRIPVFCLNLQVSRYYSIVTSKQA